MRGKDRYPRRVARVVPLSLILALAVGCASDGEETGAAGGLELRVRYDSGMNVRRLAVVGVADDGDVVWAREEVEPPLVLGPPGPREAPVALPAPEAPVLALVDGLDADGRVVGSGQASLQPPVDGPVVVQLGAPVACGDGVRSGREACDDGNTVSGDGCSALCLEEPAPPPPPPPTGPRLLETEALAPFTIEAADGEPVPDAVLSLPAPEAATRWLVFVSGVLGANADDEIAAELSVRLDDAELDAFGHQTLGDSRAGFVSFFWADRSGEVQVSLRAAAGAATVEQLRLVAVRVPDAAWAGAAAAEETLEVEGIEVPLLDLDVEVDRPGRYLLLGRGTVTEAPGGDTARLWMETPDGRVPGDARGVTFSSPRDARVPFFAAHVTALEAGDHRVAFAGTTSGSGGVQAPFDGRFAFRRRISIQAQGAAVPAGYALPVTFDHAALVSAGRARADGADVRVLYQREGQLGELARAADPQRGWNREDTTVWFRLPVGLAADGTNGDAWLYFGQPEPEDTPRGDPGEIFDLYDGFDGPELDPRWNTDSRSIRPSGGEVRLPGGAALWTQAAQDNVQSELLVEARLRFEDATASPTMYLSLGAVQDGQSRGAGFGTQEGVHAFGTPTEVRPYEPDSPEVFHRYGIGLRADAVAFWQDDVELGSVAGMLGAALGREVFMRNGADTPLVYDWVRVRDWVSPAPAVGLEPLQGSRGVQPSQFSGLRLVALRLDDLGGYIAGVASERVTTTETATRALVSVEAPPPDEDGARFVLMSARVAGESSGTGRKVGLCLADEQALLQTGHRINRDDGDGAGYHHVAGVIDAFPEGEVFTSAIRSPDGIRVDGAAAAVVVVDL